ncbi:hypothetical protein RJ641_016570 [Dillenia turbinata]|uniref:Uncharacterized protein n=1 Tax=Dillenia turbinata TaxID=194707 RepID=A0AAN8UYN3_9MAGN
MEFWSGPIFTVFADSDRNVKKIWPGRLRGEFELPRDSTLTEFVVSGQKLGFLCGIQLVTQQLGLPSKVSRDELMVPSVSRMSGEGPQIDKEEVTNSILKAKEFSNKLTLHD